jgi:zinc/manganese transport system permease protein
MTSLLLPGLVAATSIAVACGLVGYLVVLRSQVFVADALGHVAFTAALAAAAFGIDPRLGLAVGTTATAVAMGLLGPRARVDDAVIGSVFAWILGLGTLFLALFTIHQSAGNSSAAVRVLFGSILGLTGADAVRAVLVGIIVSAGLVTIARPLVFASIDPLVASSQGVAVRILGLGFLALVGITAAEATVAIGTLLLLGLIAAPAGAAYRLTANPYNGLALSAALAVLSVWVGIALAATIPAIPPTSAIITVAVGEYVAAVVVVRVRAGGRDEPAVAPPDRVSTPAATG